MSAYYKVVTTLDTYLIPGYCTNQHEHTKADIAAQFDHRNPEQIIYVVEFDIDVTQLVKVSEPVMSFDVDASINPGYCGPADPDNEFSPTQHSLDIIVWNLPVPYRKIGAYVSCLSIDPRHRLSKEYFVEESNFTIDSERGFWSTKDLDVIIPDEMRSRFGLDTL